MVFVKYFDGTYLTLYEGMFTNVILNSSAAQFVFLKLMKDQRNFQVTSIILAGRLALCQLVVRICNFMKFA